MMYLQVHILGPNKSQQSLVVDSGALSAHQHERDTLKTYSRTFTVKHLFQNLLAVLVSSYTIFQTHASCIYLLLTQKCFSVINQTCLQKVKHFNLCPLKSINNCCYLPVFSTLIENGPLKVKRG